MLWSFLSTLPRKMRRWRANTTPVATATSSLSCSTVAVLTIVIGYVVWSSVRTFSEIDLGSAVSAVTAAAAASFVSAGAVDALTDASEDGGAMLTV